MECYHCQSTNLNKRGFNRKNKQVYYCLNCKKFITEDPSYKPFTETEKTLIDRLHSEGNSARSIGRVLGRNSHVGVFNIIKKNLSTT